MKRACAPVFVTLVVLIMAAMTVLVMYAIRTGCFPRIPGPPIFRTVNPGWFWFQVGVGVFVVLYGAGLLYWEWRKK